VKIIGQFNLIFKDLKRKRDASLKLLNEIFLEFYERNLNAKPSFQNEILSEVNNKMKIH
jgi:hypothetical protein